MYFRAMSALALAPIALAACSSSPATTPALLQQATTCRNHLALEAGGPVSPMTGEHVESLALVNRGRSACVVAGSPAVELYGATGELLPFRYSHSGQYIKARSSKTSVTLQPGQKAELVLAKYRCDLGDGPVAVTVHLTFSDGGFVTGRLPVTGPAGLSYCRGQGAASNAGHVVEVGPVTPIAS